MDTALKTRFETSCTLFKFPALNAYRSVHRHVQLGVPYLNLGDVVSVPASIDRPAHVVGMVWAPVHAHASLYTITVTRHFKFFELVSAGVYASLK